MLETTWFILWGVLWAVYFALDGYDLGMGTLMPFLAKDERDRRIMYNAAGPFWDGNQVWLITAGGVTFAAFPATYAALFSGLYTALMLLLFALILRGVSFEFRRKVDSERWRKVWDFCHVSGSFLPALLLGVAFANIFQGIPLNAQGINEGGLLDLLNPYGLLGGVLFVLMFSLHGSLWLGVKSEGPIADRATAMAEKLWLALMVVVVLFLVVTAFATRLFDNYLNNPLLFSVLLLAVVGLIQTRVFLGKRSMLMAWGASAVSIISVTLFGVIGLFPVLLPSTLDPAYSMTIANSASSELTLKIMLGVTLVFVPLVIAYQTWLHITFGHKITDADLEYEEAY
ncbi:cytochrome d ubiquinol oxidase subunit II [Desulfonatronum sp. SC1]|uniref:cytochrome d ubiquinol oxidase subunit II n=1 Tax=Desulfonatronum sp. SC1 TaxID=2109626 RepID=UPI000D3147D2|nr:cytochrome d ubiquinol oxidase subunit II [Desulfonatronum sp. SC1]PTN32315.1 cytochrome d ubiquinol oxidase subunit II [Desulfonatronum sp. SC1]